MEPRRRLRLGEMLVAAGLVTEDQLRQALAAGKRSGLRLGQQLVREGTVKEADIVDLISRQTGLPDVCRSRSLAACQTRARSASSEPTSVIRRWVHTARVRSSASVSISRSRGLLPPLACRAGSNG